MRKLPIILLSLLISLSGIIGFSATAYNAIPEQYEQEQTEQVNANEEQTQEEPTTAAEKQNKPKREKSTDWFSLNIALIIAFMVALFGIINFVINYSTSFLLPNQNAQKWYENNLA